jgi:predicted metal-dependent phosphoesterase TrpH
MPPLQPRAPEGEPVASVAATGKIELSEAIALVHRAEGRAFLAHPFVFEADAVALDLLFADLKAMGLDGIEAICEPFVEVEQRQLLGLARKHGLLISAGTDFHASKAKLHGLADVHARKHGLLSSAS